METIIIVIFIIGYLLIALEHPIKINKTATALITGVLCWTLFALAMPYFSKNDNYLTFAQQFGSTLGVGESEIYIQFIKSQLAHHLSEIASILFFLMGAMTIVELVDAHHGFRFITDRIHTVNIRTLLWIICWVAFVLSSILDNLTTAIVMVSLTRKLIADKEKRMFFAGMIIIAANAGGAWSPIGDVTTTMLWIDGQITSTGIITSVLLPSILCLLVPLIYLSFKLKGNLDSPARDTRLATPWSSKLMLIVGVGSLISVPVFKSLTHLPPYMGMLLGLSILWVVSEFINPEADDLKRHNYSAAGALSRIDIPSMLFFMGILLAVAALEAMQTLHHFAVYLDQLLGDNRVIITLIGMASAVVDNVPLVAASMGMYSIDRYPTDHMVWKYLAYCAGTGGSILIIGSAAGVAVMGMEKIDFIWYLKRISLIALLGYFAGCGTYLLMSQLVP